MKLALGTAQFGLDYGAFNASGKPDLETVGQVLERAVDLGIDTLDTARAYGDAEERLGHWRAAERFRVVTKVAPLDGAGPDGLGRSCEASLAALRTDRIFALLLHCSGDLLGPNGDGVAQSLFATRDGGVAERVGVSIYAPSEGHAVLDRYPVTILQAPYTLFDRRLETSGLLARAAELGVMVHVRSVFLQGFILARLDALTGHLARYRGMLEALAATVGRGVPERRAAALSLGVGDQRIDRAVVGVDSAAQLDEIAQAVAGGPMHPDLSGLASEDEDFIDPARWT